MPATSTTEAAAAAQSPHGHSLASVSGRLLKDCIKLAAALPRRAPDDATTVRDVAKAIILKVRELRRVLGDVAQACC